jgi:hypothetical protein
VKRLFFSAALALSSGCGHDSGVAKIAGAEDVATLDDWHEVVEEHLRRDETYDWLLRTADLRAVILTPRMRQAYAKVRTEFEGRFAEEMEQELLHLGKKPDEGVDAPMVSGPKGEEEVLIFVAMYVTDRVNRDLSASYGVWDTELVKGDARVAAAKFESVKESPAVLDLFPFLKKADDLYLVRFPLVDPKTGTSFLDPRGPPLELQVTSAIASCVVSWDLEE